MNVRDMTQGRPVRLILAVALPLMMGNVFQQLYTVVDARVVGSVEGVSTLAAMGVSDWMSWLFLGLVHGLAQGFTIPMAQAFGARDEEGLRKNVGNAAVLGMISALVIMALALGLLSPVLNLLNAPAEIRAITRRYLVILFCGFPVAMAYNLMAGILRSLGDGKSPLYAMVVASLVNIGLDILFVAGLRWGVSGAAAATLIAQACSCLFCLARLRKLPFIRPRRSDLALSAPVCRRLMGLGLPVAAQNAVIGLGGMIVQRVVNGMGVNFIAGYTATNKLYGVLEVAAISYGYATSVYAGQNLGAGRFDRIRTGTRASILVGAATAAGIAGVMLLTGRAITSGFLNGTPQEVAEAGQIAWEYLRLMSLGLPILYILYSYRSCLQGMGNTVAPLASGVAEFVMRTGAVLLLPTVVGYQGVFWAEVLAWLGADMILIPGYYLYFSRLRGKAAQAAQ